MVSAAIIISLIIGWILGFVTYFATRTGYKELMKVIDETETVNE